MKEKQLKLCNSGADIQLERETEREPLANLNPAFLHL